MRHFHSTGVDRVLAKLESPASKWLVGWSCGKETLKDGKYDTLKGSYYVNCAPGFEEQQKTVAEKYPSFPEYTAPNVWPSEHLLPGFEETFRELCTFGTPPRAAGTALAGC